MFLSARVFLPEGALLRRQKSHKSCVCSSLQASEADLKYELPHIWQFQIVIRTTIVYTIAMWATHGLTLSDLASPLSRPTRPKSPLFVCVLMSGRLGRHLTRINHSRACVLSPGSRQIVQKALRNHWIVPCTDLSLLYQHARTWLRMP